MKNGRLSFVSFVLLLGVAFLISCGGGGGSSPSGAWSKTYGGSTGSGNAVKQTADGGYILSGEVKSLANGDFDAYLVKTDSQGMVLWSTTVGGSSYEEILDVQLTADGGYVFLGNTQSFGAGMTDMYLVKTDPTGTVEWSATYGGSDYDHGVSVQQTTDDGYILFGTSGNLGDFSLDMHLIKTNATGTVEWDRTYGASNWNDEGRTVRQTPDGGYILLGDTKSDATNTNGVYMTVMNLIKTDSTGTALWSKKYSDPHGGVRANALGQSSENGFILCGEAGTGVYDHRGIYLVKTDASGNEEWNTLLVNGDYSYGFSVQETTDQGYVVAGYTFSNTTEYPYETPAALYIAKVDPNGNPLWSRTYQGDGEAIAHSIQETMDGGFIIVGQTSSSPWDASMWRMLMLKTDSNGQ